VRLEQNEHGVYIDDFDYMSALESAGGVARGDYVCAVNGANIIGLSVHQVEELLTADIRPLRIGIVTKERLRAQNLLVKVDPGTLVRPPWDDAPSLQPAGTGRGVPTWSPGAVTPADSMHQQYMDDFDSPLSSQNQRTRGYQVSPDEAQPAELDPHHVYDIVIEERGPLAVHLWQDEGGGVYVHDFQSIPSRNIGEVETIGALEASGRVEQGHYLIEINDAPIKGMPLSEVVGTLRSTTSRPLHLKFWSKEPIRSSSSHASALTHNTSRAESPASSVDGEIDGNSTMQQASDSHEGESYCFFIVVDDEGPLAMHLWENSNGVYVHGFESVVSAPSCYSVYVCLCLTVFRLNPALRCPNMARQ
jgi:hypothetical protein